MTQQLIFGDHTVYRAPCGFERGTLEAAALHEDHCRKCQDILTYGPDLPDDLEHWDWPKWLLAPWVAADPNGSLWAFHVKPRWDSGIKLWTASQPDDDPTYLDPGIFYLGTVSEGGPDAVRSNPWSDSDG